MPEAPAPPAGGPVAASARARTSWTVRGETHRAAPSARPQALRFGRGFRFTISLAGRGPSAHGSRFQRAAGRWFFLEHGGVRASVIFFFKRAPSDGTSQQPHDPGVVCGCQARRTLCLQGAQVAVAVAIPGRRIANSGPCGSAATQRCRLASGAPRAAGRLHRLPVPHQQAQLQRWDPAAGTGAPGSTRRRKAAVCVQWAGRAAIRVGP